MTIYVEIIIIMSVASLPECGVGRHLGRGAEPRRCTLSDTSTRTLSLLGVLLFASVAMQASPDVFIAGAGSTVSVYDAQSFGEAASIPYPGRVFSTVFSPDGTKAYATTGTIYVTEAATREITAALPSNGALILRITNDGARLLAANADNSVWVYNLATHAVIAK